VILEALGLAIAAPLAYLWLVFLLDNLLYLPVWGRLIAVVGFLLALGWPAASLVRRWRQIHLTEDQVALAMEQRTRGGVQNRLINAIQIAREPHPGHDEFSQAVIEENCQRLRELHLEQASQVRPAMIRIATAAAVIAVGVCFWMFQRDHFTNAATR